MRRFLTILAPLLTSACIHSVPTPAHAEEYPVCLDGGAANSLECDYATLAQCQATAKGGLGSCITSPGYAVAANASYRHARKRMH